VDVISPPEGICMLENKNRDSSKHKEDEGVGIFRESEKKGYLPISTRLADEGYSSN
jgi:hypothetical protein